MTNKMALLILSVLLCITQATYLGDSPISYSTILNDNLGADIKYDYSIYKRIFAIEPFSSLKYDNKNKKQNLNGTYFLQNIGRSDVIVTDGSCLLISFKMRVHPGKHIEITGNDTHQIKNYLKIYNLHSTRAIVYITGASDFNGDPPKNYDKTEVLKRAFSLGQSYPLPMLYKGINIWKQLHEKIKVLLDDDIEKHISRIIDNDIETLIDMIISVDNSYSNSRWYAAAFMDVIKYLENFERKFVIEDTSKDLLMINFYILPYYINVVKLKIEFSDKGLYDFEEMEYYRIREFQSRTRVRAIKYVNKMYKSVIDKIYETVYPRGLYNVMMTARTHIAVHSLQILPRMSKLFLYSSFYGTATPNLFQQATPSNVRLPLFVPYFSSLISIKIHRCPNVDKTQPSILCGIGLIFTFNKVIHMGTRSKEVNTLYYIYGLNGSITKLTVYGGNIIKCLEFTFDHRTTFSFGDDCLTKPHVFELENHYIASLYVSNDNPDTGLYLDNIAVSFMQQ